MILFHCVQRVRSSIRKRFVKHKVKIKTGIRSPLLNQVILDKVNTLDLNHPCNGIGTLDLL